jgi:nickel/cobalt transporter (NiCoT) family protein
MFRPLDRCLGLKVKTARSLAGMFACIGGLHVVGWFVLIAFVVPQHLTIGTKAFGIGVGLAAYMLGARHAFDADHIAAIDNTTRRLTQGETRPLSIGFWFSLGHSSVVFGLTLLLSFGIRDFVEPLLDEHSSLHNMAGLTGTIVSVGFLYAIAALNLIVLIEMWRFFRRPIGQLTEAPLEHEFLSRGPMNRLVGPLMKFVGNPCQMYFVGLLFGLSFDTATEIVLLVLAGSGAASHLPWYAILCLPVLFAAGMTLFDTADGCLMSLAYSWAVTGATRKIYYNFVVTGLSVVAAVIIGTVEIAVFLGETLELRGAFWNSFAIIDLNRLGFVIVGLFIALLTAMSLQRAPSVRRYRRFARQWWTM